MARKYQLKFLLLVFMEKTMDISQQFIITNINTQKIIRMESENCAAPGQEKWIKHYCRSQKILLVGEGDFSFALCLATAFGSAINITATSLDSASLVRSRYPNAEATLVMLESHGCKILHEVDVHTMSQHPVLMPQLFDRIVFNFPHAGWAACNCEHNAYQIRLHQDIVRGFLDSARNMLAMNGEIHVTHKTTCPFSMWRIEDLAEKAGLCLSKEVYFDQWDYPCYRNVRGSEYKCNKTFPVGECSTFMFKRVGCSTCEDAKWMYQVSCSLSCL